MARHRKSGWVAHVVMSKSGGWAIIKNEEENTRFFAHCTGFVTKLPKVGTRVQFTMLPPRSGEELPRATEVTLEPRKHDRRTERKPRLDQIRVMYQAGATKIVLLAGKKERLIGTLRFGH
jgi:hypothetical protein